MISMQYLRDDYYSNAMTRPPISRLSLQAKHFAFGLKREDAASA